jgi:hypothetical protein
MKTFLSLSLALTTGLTFAQAPDKKDAPIRPTPLAPAQPQVRIRKPIGTIIRPPQLPQAVINTNSLLKVNVTYQNYNVQIPWQKESAGGRRGLGVVLPKNRVLVTAQMVAARRSPPRSKPSITRRISPCSHRTRQPRRRLFSPA